MADILSGRALADRRTADPEVTPPHPPRLGRVLVLSLVLLVLTLAGVSLVADIRELGPLARAFDRHLLLPIFLLAPANYVFRFYKWTILLRRAGLRVPVRPSLTIFLAGLSMAVTPAKAGELVKAYYLKETLGVPYRTSTPVVVAERVLDSASVLVLAVVGAVAGAAAGVGADRVGVPRFGAAAGLASCRYGAWILGASAVGLAAAVLFLRSPGGPAALAKALSRLGLVGRRAAGFLEGFGEASRRLLDPWTFAWCTLVGIISWSLEGFVVYFTLAGLGQAAPPLLGVFVVALASLAGAVSLLPGGAGAAEGTILSLLLLSGYPRAIAGATTVVTRAATLWLGVAVGAVGISLAERQSSQGRPR